MLYFLMKHLGLLSFAGVAIIEYDVVNIFVLKNLYSHTNRIVVDISEAELSSGLALPVCSLP